MKPGMLLFSVSIAAALQLQAQSGMPPVFAVEGFVTDSLSGDGLAGVELLLPYQKRIVVTGPDGSYRFDGMPAGMLKLCLPAEGSIDTLRFYADPQHPRLPNIRISRPPLPEAAETAIPEITAPTDDADDSGPSGSDYGSATQAGRNPFVDATAFNLFPFRFQARSYGRRSQEVAINSVPVQDPATQYVPWNSWSGLNDAFRNRDHHYGAGASDALFGGAGGSLGFDLSAAAQRPQTRLSYGLTNRSYRNRFSLSRSSGVLPSGWAWSVNASYRSAAAGFAPGSFYEGLSLFAGLSRMLSATSSLHLNVCGAWSRAGRSAAVTEETVQLSGDTWYNPNWGLQAGRVRNARVSSGCQPFAVLTHQYRPGSRLRVESSVLLQAGRSGTTGLDYYNASNPRPDYYRYLPSYLSASGRDPQMAAFLSNPQIDWDELHQQNRLQWDSVPNADGIAGNTVAGRRSVYALYRDVQELRKLAVGLNLQWRPLPLLRVSGGISGIEQAEARFRELADLLGGDFYLNTNAFIESGANGSLAQYDLGVPDRIIRAGDRYNYDYIARSRELAAWAGLQLSLRRLDLHLEGKISERRYQREGRFRNGLFPDASFGPATGIAMCAGTLKAGIAYRISGRTQAIVNAVFGALPPGFDQAYISPRVRNAPNPEAAAERIQSLEAGIAHRAPGLQLHLIGFATRSAGGSEIRRYYSDDPAFASFVNYLMTGVAKQVTGLELGAQVQLSPLIALRTAVSLADAFFAGNPDAVFVYGDNDTTQLPVRKQVYLKNLALATGPQTAGTLAVTYRSTRYWFVGLTANYASRSFVDVNPDRRTEQAIRGLAPEDPLYSRILQQERLPAAWTLDLSAGKNWLLSRYLHRLPRNTYLYLNASLANLLDRRFRTGGYEQLRFDYAGQDPGKFASKYFYAVGRNFLVSLSLRW